MNTAIPSASPVLYWGFLLLAVAMALGLVFAIRATSGSTAFKRSLGVTVVWMGLTGTLAAKGILDSWAPPPMFLLMLMMIAFLVWASRKPWTNALGDLPLKLLVGFQGFRVIVEVLIHQAVVEGVAHPVMTWTGTNFDIIAGITALVLAPFAHRIDTRLLQIWNVSMALVLVLTVVTGILAAPTPLRAIWGDPPNVWITRFPFVWLPCILVLSAWLGHIVLFRRLYRDMTAAGP